MILAKISLHCISKDIEKRFKNFPIYVKSVQFLSRPVIGIKILVKIVNNSIIISTIIIKRNGNAVV